MTDESKTVEFILKLGRVTFDDDETVKLPTSEVMMGLVINLASAAVAHEVPLNKLLLALAAEYAQAQEISAAIDTAGLEPCGKCPACLARKACAN